MYVFAYLRFNFKKTRFCREITN